MRRITELGIILTASIATGCGGDADPPTGSDNRLAELIPRVTGNSMTVVSVGETVVTLLDSFSCYKYRSYPLGGGEVDTSYFYIEPGTGLAKKEIVDNWGRLKARPELIRTSLTEANPAGGYAR